jgi:hypothetical protein
LLFPRHIEVGGAWQLIQYMRFNPMKKLHRFSGLGDPVVPPASDMLRGIEEQHAIGQGV